MMLDAHPLRPSSPWDLVLLEPGARARVLVRDISSGNVAEPVAWSPSRQELAFAAGTSSSSNIDVVNANGSGLHALTTTGDAGYPVWSRNGRQIFFARHNISVLAPAGSDIWSMNADGSALRQLTPFVENQSDVPSSASPNGTLLAFTRQLTPGLGLINDVSFVRLLNLRTGTQTSFAKNSSDAIFTPNGRSLILASTHNKDGTSAPTGDDDESYLADLFRANVQGGPWREITHTARASESDPTISSNGARIAYQSSVPGSRSPSLFEANADGSCPTPLGQSDALYIGPAWQPQAPGTLRPLRCRV